MKHKVRHIHFVGIGGAGMSGIAEVLLNLGYRISGSDVSASAATRRLAELGATVRIGHDAAHIDGADCIVVSTAVRGDNPEVIAARARRVPLVPRALMLAELMKLKQGVAIAGTHGKTTTTSLVASVLAAGGLDPTFVIGGRLVSAGANARLGSADHMETYGHDFARLRQAFVDFTQRLPFYGAAVLCIDDPHVREILPFVSKPVLTYGFAPEAQFRAVDPRPDGARMRFTVQRVNGVTRPPLEVVLNAPGLHNVQNALAAIAVADELQVPDEAIVRALADFHGVGRRFQRYGDVPARGGGTFTLIDDYGHHPAEMAATLAAARGAFPGRRLLLAFQPHRFTRTRDLFEDFVRVLSTPDALLLAEVYPAGEAPIVAADGRSLARAVRVAGRVEPVFVEDIAGMPQAILEAARDGDVVLTMGAGSVGAVPAAVRELAGETEADRVH
jgi:UDP-N-acetylmuramate--alanine ligase